MVLIYSEDCFLASIMCSACFVLRITNLFPFNFNRIKLNTIKKRDLRREVEKILEKRLGWKISFNHVLLPMFFLLPNGLWNIFDVDESSYSWQRRKGTISLIEIQNPNFVKPRTTKAKDANVSWNVPFTFHFL